MSTIQKILMIDDDKKFSLGLVAVLRRAGYQVLTASNGAEGLETIRAECPDLILCDIMMPPPNGIELKKALANDPQTGRIPFLFLTARTAAADRVVCLESGADDYITKPFDVDELLARIQSVLRRDDLGHQRGMQEATGTIDQLRTSIAASLSHEMRTPLTVINSTLELVVRDKFIAPNKELIHFVKRASSSAYRIDSLVNDLEMLHDIDRGKMRTIRQKVDPKFHLKAPIEKIMTAWENKQLNFHVNISPGLNIYAPCAEFSHVVAHLVDNACKFSPDNGNITISARANGLGGCAFEVVDEGWGIPLDLREKVFERYYQVNQKDTRLYGGLGIGLTIARAFTQSLDGDIQVLDSPSGCRVRMVLPPYDPDKKVLEGV